ncbi:MAG: helix-turn-helix domain-containing protein [Lachnospiraceae bacterium]|nr:helix-turn-helix domain-containing protein [Lachnospiraceae bacterium]
MSVGDNIRCIREKRKLSQAYVARQTQVTPQMICQIERGTRSPSLQLGADIAKALGCSLEDLLTGGAEKPADTK